MLIYNVTPILTCLIGIASILLGFFLIKRVKFLRICMIPAPVVGGLIFSIVSLILYKCNIVEFHFDDTLRNFFMTLFFASVGLMASFKMLKKDSLNFLKLGVITFAIIVCQNFISLGIGSAFGWNPLLSLSTGSIPFIGGHGTASSFGPILENRGAVGATSLAATSATFGLIIGSLIGAPISGYVINKKKIRKDINESNDAKVEGKAKKKNSFFLSESATLKYLIIIVILLFSCVIGDLLTQLLSNLKIGNAEIAFPPYIGALLIAIVLRNVLDLLIKAPMPEKENSDIGKFALYIFLGIALIDIKLWQLEGLGLGLLTIIIAQTLFVFVVARYIAFNWMGKDYIAAIIISAICGYALGATPNAMANMKTVTNKYGPCPEAFVLIPIVGTIFVDILNIITLTGFISVFS